MNSEVSCLQWKQSNGEKDENADGGEAGAAIAQRKLIYNAIEKREKTKTKTKAKAIVKETVKVKAERDIYTYI